jgi:EAL domain-containing protein (putative c-di-GMP-specific phosphodiesterase class I)
MLTQLDGADAQAMGVALGLAEDVRQAILEPLNLDLLHSGEEGRPLAYQCSASIGVALYGAIPESLTEVLKRADVAMYQAKQSGRNAIRQYDPQAQELLKHKAALTADLSTALAQQQLALHYQVQCNMAGTPVGAECLLRWQHPTRGAVSPVEFIGLAEESGAIVAMGNWVLRTACHTLAQWAVKPGFEHLTLSVNVSPRQFNELDFVACIQATLAETGAQPDKLVLEITEGIVLGHAEDTIQKMHQLRAMGIAFSIDDFGTGYSSLSYLQRLPLREVKIDKAFVRDVTHDPNSAAIVRAIIALGESLQLEVVSEGVETAAQKAMLEALGCDVLQGYLLGRPVARSVFEAELARSTELV